VFEVDSDFPGKIVVKGGADDEDRFELKLKESLDVVASNKSVSLSNGVQFALAAIEDLIVSARAGVTSRVDVSAWNLAGEIVGTGADVTVVATNNLPEIRLQVDKLIRSGKEILLANVLAAEITGGSGKNVINATGFTGKARLKGLGGDDTLTGGDGDDVLEGGKGKDTFNGGPGTDVVSDLETGETQTNIP
jgi:Ca2+-binding RTX toxin-like protein